MPNIIDYTPVPYGITDDELRNLSQAVNQMARALEQSMRQARDSDRAAMLTQLAGGLAHHLRNALTGARVSLQLHQKHCSWPDDEAVLVALAQLKRTEEHIKALLRVSQGKPASTRPSRLSTVLNGVASLVSPLCNHHRVDFSFQSDDADCMINDAEAMQGALLNLLTNAIEAAGPHGCVKLEAFHESGAIIVNVKDNGPGVSPEIIQDIFDPFFTTKEEGIGIGLPMAKRAAEDCGGKLTVARMAEITVFEMSIPMQTYSEEDKFPEEDACNTTRATSMKEMSHE